jgi:hypothetical protein
MVPLDAGQTTHEENLKRKIKTNGEGHITKLVPEMIKGKEDPSLK